MSLFAPQAIPDLNNRCGAWSRQLMLNGVRNLDLTDDELRLMAAVRDSIREHGVKPSHRHIDELLDERKLVMRQANAARSSGPLE